jgi:hypothetical protein
MVVEWTNEDPRGKLDIPKELLNTQKYRFTAKDIGLTGTCAAFEGLLGGVQLLKCLVDTSERVHGTTLKRRVTYRKQLHLFSIAVVVFPFNDDEHDDSPDTSLL